MTRNDNIVPLSFSGLAAYRDCPYQAKHRKYSKNVANQTGNVVHEAIKALLTNDQAEGQRVLEAGIVAESLPSDAAKDALEMFSEFLTKPFYNPPKERIITVESEDGETMIYGKPYFMVPLPVAVDGKQIALRGAMDLVVTAKNPVDGIEIFDWKTGFLDADEFQAELYALVAYLKYWRTSPITVRFCYLRRGFSSKETYTDADMPGILQYVSILAAAYVRETEWKPKFGAACKYCDFKLTCPEFLEKMAKAPVKPEIDPNNFEALTKWVEHLADIKGAASKLYDEFRDLQKAYLEKNKTAKLLDGREFFLREQAYRYNYSDEAVKKVLADIGMPQTAGFSFDRGVFDSYVKDAIVKGTMTAEQAGKAFEAMDEIAEAVKGVRIREKKVK